MATFTAGTKRSREASPSIETPQEKRPRLCDSINSEEETSPSQNNTPDLKTFDDSEVVDGEDSRLSIESLVSDVDDDDSNLGCSLETPTFLRESESSLEEESTVSEEAAITEAEEDDTNHTPTDFDQSPQEEQPQQRQQQSSPQTQQQTQQHQRDFLQDVGRAEYRIPIDRFTLAREHDSWPSGEYLHNNRAVTLENRRELFIWMAEALAHFRCHSETHMLAFSIMHRYVKLTPDLPLSRLQLAGLAVLFLALKFSEHPPYLGEFVEALLPKNRDISPDDVLEMEKEILGTIDWDLTCPLPLHFLVSYYDVIDPPPGFTIKQAWFMCLYVVELMMEDACLLRFTPSTVAASAVYVTRILALTFQPDQFPAWTPQLQEVTGKVSNDLRDCVHQMIHLLQREARYLQAQDYPNMSPATLTYTSSRHQAVSCAMAKVILSSSHRS